MKILKAPLMLAITDNIRQAYKNQRDADHIYYMEQCAQFMERHEGKHYTLERWTKIKKDAGFPKI